MQSILSGIPSRIAAGILFAGLISVTAPVMADNTATCNSIEAALEDLYQVPYGTEDWAKIKVFEDLAKGIGCDFMIL
ncbi:MAG TPA: hypothetical protein VGM52_11800 [Herbaspirillum sp.]|jgi:hypothetical protein